jgi:hypothetical protein
MGVETTPSNKAMKLTSALAEPAVCGRGLWGLGQRPRTMSEAGARVGRSQLIAGVLRTRRKRDRRNGSIAETERRWSAGPQVARRQMASWPVTR